MSESASESAADQPSPTTPPPASGKAPLETRIKSLFVLPFLLVQAGIFVHSLAVLAAEGRSLVWLGPLVSSAGVLGFMAWLASGRAARTSASLPNLLMAGVIGVCLSLSGVFVQGAGLSLAVIYAFASFGGTLLYIFWYSRLGRERSPLLSVGQTLPDFSLEDLEGRPFASAELRGRPALLLFYRGNWCPLCMAQVREIADRYRELSEHGAQVVLVSPQSHENARALAKRFDVPFRFLVDRGGQAARALSISHPSGVPAGVLGYDRDTVLPTAIVTDAEGRILLCDQTDNYRLRPEPDTFLEVLEANLSALT